MKEDNKVVMETRAVRFGDAADYEVAFVRLAGFAAGKDREVIAESAYAKLAAVGKPTGERNGRLLILTLDESLDDQTIHLTIGERDLVLDAIRGWDAPTFLVAAKRGAIDALVNAPESAP